jgi:hypothetical protein
MQGIVAQRLDSSGNIMWGDSGKVISPFNSSNSDFDISTDGQGGLFLAVSPAEPTEWTDLYLQKVDSNGNILWGPQGVCVAGTPNQESRYPKVTHGAVGDAFVVWNDSRPPAPPGGSGYIQRFDSAGQQMWPNDILIAPGGWHFQVIPDEQGGFILQTPGGDFNLHKRIGPDGNIIWQRDHLSWYYWGNLVEGDADYFYLGFDYSWGTYGQKVRISDGMNMWPTWGSGQPGAVMTYNQNWGHFNNSNFDYRFVYRYPYFYGITDYSVNMSYPKLLYGQALDSSGNGVIGNNGVLLTSTNDSTGFFSYICIVPVEEGIVGVFEKYYEYDIWAKRAYMNGALGGPLSPIQGLRIIVNDSNTVITWPSQADSARYHIYKSSFPYNFTIVPDTTILDTSYIDVGGLNQPQRFYRVSWQP